MSPTHRTVAVQGEAGCNSALAAEQVFGPDQFALLPCRTFAEMFGALATGAADSALAPVENSLGGSVHPVWELLERGSYTVRKELYLHVRHCLIAHPAVPLQEIRRIFSHEQALAQCRRFLRRLVWIDPEDVVATYDTAGAVKMVRARGRREEAAIASQRAAEIYGMRTLAADIQTDPDNFTRFLLLDGPGRGQAAQPGLNQPTPAPGSPVAATRPTKSTLILTIEGNGTPLPAILAAVGEAELQVLKLETVKLIGSPWQYRVYLDLDTTRLGGAWDPAQVLSGLRALVRAMRLVGTYPLAPLPGPQSSMS